MQILDEGEQFNIYFLQHRVFFSNKRISDGFPKILYQGNFYFLKYLLQRKSIALGPPNLLTIKHLSDTYCVPGTLLSLLYALVN